MGSTAILGCIGTLHGTCSRLILTGTVNVILRLYDMLALAQTVKEIVRRIIAWGAVVATLSVIATQLFDGLQTGSTFVLHLHEVEVTFALDGQTDGDTIAHFKR